MTADQFLKIYKAIDADSSSEDIQAKFHKIMEENSLQEIPGAIHPNKEQLRMQELFERGNMLARYIRVSNLKKSEQIFLLSVVVKNLGITLDDTNQES